MGQHVQGKDGKFQGSIGTGKSRVPTPATGIQRASDSLDVEAPADSGSSYEEKFARMQETKQARTHVEDGVTWTEASRTQLDNGYTVVDEHAKAVYRGLKSEGYTGVRPGSPVNVKRTQWIKPDGTVGRTSYACSTGGAWLGLYHPDDELEMLRDN